MKNEINTDEYGMITAALAHEKTNFAKDISDLKRDVVKKIDEAIHTGLYKITVLFDLKMPENIIVEITVWIESFGYKVNIYKPVLGEGHSYDQRDYLGEIGINW